MSPLFELKLELRTFNSQEKASKEHVGPINVRGPAICCVKLTARVIRSVFQSLKISNVAYLNQAGSLYVIHYNL